MLHDVAVVGGGIVGLATARALTRLERPRAPLVLEKEARLAAHQTGHNSGVIHSGVYYRPGSLKARFTVEGARRLVEYCRERGIAHEVCGKVVVALDETERERLVELHRRGLSNGVPGVRMIDLAELREIEPYATGVAAMRVRSTGIVDFVAVSGAYANDVRAAGGEICTGTMVRGLRRDADQWRIETSAGEHRARALINCAGLHCDRIAAMAGARPRVRIIPFRGEYYTLRHERRHLVRALIYPVPDPAFPFLGVHFTRMVDGGVEAGPNAVLSLCREGYRKTDFRLSDVGDFLAFPGFWRMAAAYWRTGIGEMNRSLRKPAFVRALQRLLPEIRGEDLVPGGAGVRAQAVDRDGRLLDDFSIERGPGAVHVLNAPSPAATASLPIGEAIAHIATEHFGWNV